jgi:hypothetical protein
MTKKDYEQIDSFVESSLEYVEKMSTKIDDYLDSKSQSFMMGKGSNVEDLGYALMELESAIFKVRDKVSFLI